MINYKQLRLAHEFVNKLNGAKFVHVLGNFKDTSSNIFSIMTNSDYFSSEDLDEVLDRINELLQLQTMFKVGDQVWFISTHGGITNGIIDFIDIRPGLPDLFYVFHKSYEASVLYKSQEALINAQADYWNDLKQKAFNDE